MSLSAQAGNGNWLAKGEVSVTVNGQAASNRLVKGRWSDGSTHECRTASNGRCTLTDWWVSNTASSTTLTITSIDGKTPGGTTSRNAYRPN